MKLKNINPQHVEHMVPSWVMNPIALAKGLDEQLSALFEQRPKLQPKRWDKSVRFWIEVEESGDQWLVRVVEPAGEHEHLYCGQVVISFAGRSLVVPLNAMFKGSDRLDTSHCVYVHTIMTECPMSYIGITKHRWFDRYAQHKSSAERGSSFVFHAALRDHADKPVQHRVLLAGLNYASALHYEEQFVADMTLYPNGLNMIPGGNAGIRYLHKLGIIARTAEERDQQIEAIAERETIGGQPNPLCAARWAADQDYVNRVICGHSGRLTVAQVRQIRLLSSFGRGAVEVSAASGASIAQVKGVVSGSVYGRVQ